MKYQHDKTGANELTECTVMKRVQIFVEASRQYVFNFLDKFSFKKFSKVSVYVNIRRLIESQI